ncbi:uncharacterized protein [Panulirus ornatus]|uniref:uncharacterized protein n=1 Tax=Panulirus ornatus TaxID=150431 RepID=UPI003A8B0EC7
MTRHKDRQETTTTAKSNVKKTGIGRPSTETVAREGLHSLDELESHAWIDSNTRAVLLTVAVVEPGTATAATIAIIFEHFGGSRRTAEGGGETWWVSHSTSSVDLKYNVKKLVLLIMFLVVHIFVVIHELEISVVSVSVAYVMQALGEVVRRCASRATVLNLVILALHICLVLFSFRISAASRHEFNKVAVAFKLAFSPDVVRNDTLLYDIYYHERLGHWHLTGGVQSQPGFGRSNSHNVEDTAPGKDHFGHGSQSGEEGRQHFFGEGNGTIAGDGGGTDFFGEGHGLHGGDEDGNFLGGVEDKLDLGDGGSFFSSNETLELFPVEKRKSRPQSSWPPEYNTQILRVRFGPIIHWNDVCIVLLTAEVLLYLTKLSVFEDYCGAALRTVMKTLQLGSLGVLATLALLLSLLTAAAYVIHTHDGGEDGRNCFTFLTLLKATLSYCLSLDDSWSDGCGSPSRLLETLGVVMVLVGAISAIVVFRVVASRQRASSPSVFSGASRL